MNKAGEIILFSDLISLRKLDGVGFVSVDAE